MAHNGTYLGWTRDRPNASSLNYITGSTVPNTVITKLGVDDKIYLYTQAATHLIADLNGYET